MAYKMPKGYDNWVTSGYKHRCGDCGEYYYDSDGGCGCRDDDENKRGTVDVYLLGRWDVTYWWDGEEWSVLDVNAWVDLTSRLLEHLSYWCPADYETIINYKPSIDDLQEVTERD